MTSYKANDDCPAQPTAVRITDAELSTLSDKTYRKLVLLIEQKDAYIRTLKTYCNE